MAKKKNNLTLEEKLKNALVPEEEQPYQIPDNWVWTRLGEVFEWGSGGTPSRKEKENFEGKIPWFKTGELNNEYLSNSEERITQRALDNSSAKLYPPNTVIMAMYGATIGKLGILSVDGTTNQACACAKPNKYVLVKYLFFYLMSRKEDFIKKGKGGAQPNISQEIIKEYKFPLPPFQEQQRIVERIESLFSKLDEAKEKIQMSLDSFETRKSAILYQAFSGELTKKWREENGIKFDEWEELNLDSVMNRVNEKFDPQDNESNYKYIGLEHFEKNNGIIGYGLSEEVKSIKSVFKKGNILYGRLRPYLNKHDIAKFDGICSTDILVYSNKENCISEYVNFLMDTIGFIEFAVKNSKGINLPRVSDKSLSQYRLLLPPLEEQKEIVRILDTIFDKEQDTQELIDLIEKIDLMKKSILERAFIGELGTNIPEEESAIELLKSVLEV